MEGVSILTAHSKVEDTINSCENLAQLENAMKMVVNFRTNYGKSTYFDSLVELCFEKWLKHSESVN